MFLKSHANHQFSIKNKYGDHSLNFFLACGNNKFQRWLDGSYGGNGSGLMLAVAGRDGWLSFLPFAGMEPAPLDTICTTS
jgi:hypothetical protein